MKRTHIPLATAVRRPHPILLAAAAVVAATGVVVAAALIGNARVSAEGTANGVAATTPAPATTAPAAPPRAAAGTPRRAATSCADCGVIVAIQSVKVQGDGSGLGVVAGGVVGGVIGNQIGGGSGRDAARVLGALGGAVAGHQIEKEARSSVHYRVEVRLDGGQTRTISLASPPPFEVGDRVRTDGVTLQRA